MTGMTQSGEAGKLEIPSSPLDPENSDKNPKTNTRFCRGASSNYPDVIGALVSGGRNLWLPLQTLRSSGPRRSPAGMMEWNRGGRRSRAGKDWRLGSVEEREYEEREEYEEQRA